MDALLELLATARLETGEGKRWRIPKRVAYVVNHSLPFSSNGYATRTHGMAAALVAHGFEVYAFTRPGYPWNLPGFADHDAANHHLLDGVHYIHTRKPGLREGDEVGLARANAAACAELFRVFKPSAVIAASNFENALPALIAARQAGLPFIYEVRGFWELSRASREPHWEGSPAFTRYVRMETEVGLAADKVVTLNQPMAEELARRGIAPEKIIVVPNGVPALPAIKPRDPQLAASLGLEGSLVVGYIGSLNAYEGLDDLVVACGQLRRQGLGVKLLIVGSSDPLGTGQPTHCEFSDALRRLAGQTGLGGHLVFAGWVGQAQIGGYYALADVVAVPRKPDAVSELVPPIKPLEAMAYGRPLVVSDVRPLADLVAESGLGVACRKGDPAGLAAALRPILEDKAGSGFGEKSRRWVADRRLWSKVSLPLVAELEQAGLKPVAPRAAPATVPAPSQGRAEKLRVAAVMDEFTYHSFAPECELLQLRPDTWQQQLESFMPELLFIESAWRGIDELWQRKIGNASQELVGAINWCKSKWIPTLFWNKEDPIHFETFLTTASLFDYVFTTDIDCIHRYKAALGHERVFLLPFACQPAMHNPVELYQRKDAFCFAGAYYVRYPDRTRDLGNFVEQLPKFRPLEIFDRNYGKDDPNYQFPPEYQPYIVGTLPFDQIDKAYKGYRYAINLNSIKQSQTMFARRVFELLGSNTITVSNFSRGIRLLFGDLVITTDNGVEMVRRLGKLAGDEENSEKLRLAALRKVMLEHTYAHRLSYVASKAMGRSFAVSLPSVLIFAKAEDGTELDTLVDHWQRQYYGNVELLIVVSDEALARRKFEDQRITLLSRAALKGKALGEITTGVRLLVGMVAEDYYGPNYVLDIALATRYSQAKAIGKACFYEQSEEGITLRGPGIVYRPTDALPVRSAAVHCGLIANEDALVWVDSLAHSKYHFDGSLAIDPYNYCRNAGQTPTESLLRRVNDLDLYPGLDMNAVQRQAESISPPKRQPQSKESVLTATQLSQIFGPLKNNNVELRVEGQDWLFSSSLPDGKHEYLYAAKFLTLSELGGHDQIKFFFDVTPGLNLQLVMRFLDAGKQRISQTAYPANRNQVVDVPAKTAFVQLGLRVYASGQARVKTLVLGHRDVQTSIVLGQAKHLLLTNQYPSYDDIYRYAFIHTRVKAYQECGLRVDILRLRKNEPISYHEFENIDIVTASQEMLHKTLERGRYKSVLVHFLDPTLWEVLQAHLHHVKVIVWVHGFEIQPWHRRAYNYSTEAEREAGKEESGKRMAFWRSVLRPMHKNLKLVFVSRYFAEEVMEDYGFRLPDNQYEIIHNPINTGLFNYQEKPIKQRNKLLSIRPFASRQYANDLTVKAIQLLADKPWFNEMEIRIIGDGKLFEETLMPLRQYPNIIIERKFLMHAEIAMLHKEYGVFLCPTRWDSHGVSRDEAMSSGLVPVTTEIAAIPEFVDRTCGILVPAEDAKAMADGIAELYESPALFSRLSKSASNRVRQQSSSELVAEKEINLIKTFAEED